MTTRTAASIIGRRLIEPAGAPLIEGTPAEAAVAGVNVNVSAPYVPIGR